MRRTRVLGWVLVAGAFGGGAVWRHQQWFPYRSLRDWVESHGEAPAREGPPGFWVEDRGVRTPEGLTAAELERRVNEAAEGVPALEAAGDSWVPFDRIPLPFGEVTADPQQEQRISHGQTVLVRQLAGDEGDWVKMVNQRRELIAVGTVVERIGTGGVGIVQPRVVFR